MICRSLRALALTLHLSALAGCENGCMAPPAIEFTDALSDQDATLRP